MNNLQNKKIPALASNSSNETNNEARTTIANEVISRSKSKSSKVSVQDAEECPICMEEILPSEEPSITASLLCNNVKLIQAPRYIDESISTRSCKHVFHVDCIKIWAKQGKRGKKNCPRCPL